MTGCSLAAAARAGTSLEEWQVACGKSHSESLRRFAGQESAQLAMPSVSPALGGESILGCWLLDRVIGSISGHREYQNSVVILLMS